MHANFWHERWKNNQIGFHQPSVNPSLLHYWPQLGISQGTVFVPLCGKSLDMVWLAEQGLQVLGVELSRLALTHFFEQQQLTPRITRQQDFEHWQAGPYTLLCGDFFQLTAAQLQAVNAVYDRAALVALPASLRQQYSAALQNLLPASAPILLQTFEYDQAQMDGPPFSVDAAEVQTLFGHWRQIDCLSCADTLAQNERFQAKGLRTLHESVYQLHGNSDE